MKIYDAYLFDWDGTLAQTLEAWLVALRETYEKFEVSVTDEQIMSGFGDWHAALKFGLAKEKYPEFRKAIEKRSYELISTAPLYDGAKEVLYTLKKRNKKLGLVTSSMQDVISAVLSHHDIVDLFDVVITANDVTNHKPHPESIDVAIERLGAHKDRVLMVGDSEKDLLAAESASVDSLLFFPDSHKKFYEFSVLKKANPTDIINKWSELLDAERN